ncbi:Uncharacterized protein dnm_060310 [Desulfonema magnum]|uniref:Uncharacterized protein n=1 Tax=Desulfonema magnum TaxID=45655 RepID=A0A975BR93_9BACT|nr:Uncharacterized protein dnm_060310 [Desulfonema magnum]
MRNPAFPGGAGLRAGKKAGFLPRSATFYPVIFYREMLCMQCLSSFC